MARGYGEWDIPDETRGRFDESIRQGSYRLPAVREAGEVQRMQDQIGREELTGRLAGTRDKSSRQWKSARDSLSRWRSGRRAISAQGTGRLRSAGEEAARDKLSRAQSVSVDLHVRVRTSRTTWTGHMRADLTGSDLRDYVAALADGNYEEAAQIVADAYGLDPEYIEGVEEVHGFEASAVDEDREED